MTMCQGGRHVMGKDGTCVCESEWAKSPAGRVATLAAAAVVKAEEPDGVEDMVDYIAKGHARLYGGGIPEMGTDGDDRLLPGEENRT